MEAYIDRALAEQHRGVSLPFVILDQQRGNVIGTTRFMDIALNHRRLEIGATWITSKYQRTGANLEAKLLLLGHAFDALAVKKVVLKTETLNVQSRVAILGLGAQQEGIFLQHLVTDDGRARDMAYFAIRDTDWPAVRLRLQARLAGPRLGRRQS